MAPGGGPGGAGTHRPDAYGLAKQLLTEVIAGDIRRIEEVDLRRERRLDRPQRLPVVRFAPFRAPHRLQAEPNNGKPNPLLPSRRLSMSPPI